MPYKVLVDHPRYGLVSSVIRGIARLEYNPNGITSAREDYIKYGYGICVYRTLRAAILDTIDRATGSIPSGNLITNLITKERIEKGIKQERIKIFKVKGIDKMPLPSWHSVFAVETFGLKEYELNIEKYSNNMWPKWTEMYKSIETLKEITLNEILDRIEIKDGWYTIAGNDKITYKIAGNDKITYKIITYKR